MVITRGGELLPGPFCEWLEARANELGGHQAVADSLGVDEGAVRRWLGQRGGGSGLLSVVVIDRALTAGGASIAQMYGSLYDVARIPNKNRHTDWCGERCNRCSEKLRAPAHMCGFCLEEVLIGRGYPVEATKKARLVDRACSVGSEV